MSGVPTVMDLAERREADRAISKARKDARRKMRSDAHPFGKHFWERVDQGEPNDCWEWLGGYSGTGYGYVAYEGKGWATHRVAWILTLGPIPPGWELHHTCENKGCVNPDHLEPVSRSQHLRAHAGDFCQFGHPFEDRADGKRECKVCRAAKQKAAQSKRNAQQRERRRRKREEERSAQ